MLYKQFRVMIIQRKLFISKGYRTLTDFWHHSIIGRTKLFRKESFVWRI